MKTLTIAGVPEHFNLPWHLCIDNGDFKNANIDLKWANVPEGTGKLCQMLRDGSTDIAVILTEGIIKDISATNHSKIVQIYVQSPLLWGIHVDANSNLTTIDDLEHKIIAISRFGSGSHLMAIVHAKSQSWDVKKMNFEVINTIEGAVKSLANKSSDYFMWEHFMTKPLVDSGVFRRIGDCPSPWPSFVIAVRNEILDNYPQQIKSILETVNAKTESFKTIPNIDQILATKYNLKIEDIQKWLSITSWTNKNFTEQEIKSIQNQLFDLEIIDKKTTFASLIEVI